eukprot:COSAG01_NODE_31532_length_596_cov_0.406439_1_plen_59_part_01
MGDGGSVEENIKNSFTVKHFYSFVLIPQYRNPILHFMQMRLTEPGHCTPSRDARSSHPR